MFRHFDCDVVYEMSALVLEEWQDNVFRSLAAFIQGFQDLVRQWVGYVYVCSEVVGRYVASGPEYGDVQTETDHVERFQNSLIFILEIFIPIIRQIFGASGFYMGFATWYSRAVLNLEGIIGEKSRPTCLMAIQDFCRNKVFQISVVWEHCDLFGISP